jgi:hypothetical protein
MANGTPKLFTPSLVRVFLVKKIIVKRTTKENRLARSRKKTCSGLVKSAPMKTEEIRAREATPARIW